MKIIFSKVVAQARIHKVTSGAKKTPAKVVKTPAKAATKKVLVKKVSTSVALVSNKIVEDAKKFIADAKVKAVLDTKGSRCIVFRLAEPVPNVVKKLTAIYGNCVRYKTAISYGFTWDLAEHGIVDILVLRDAQKQKIKFLTMWSNAATQPTEEADQD